MTLDPNIILQGAPSGSAMAKMEGPIDSAMKAAELRAQQQQNAMGGIKLQQAQQGYGDDQAIRQAAQASGGDKGAFMNSLLSLGTPGAMAMHNKLQLEQLEQAKERKLMAEAAQRMTAQEKAATDAKLQKLAKDALWVKSQGINAPKAWDHVLTTDPDYQTPELQQYVGKYDPSHLDRIIGQAVSWQDTVKMMNDKGSKPATPHAGIGPDGKPAFFTMGEGNTAVPVSGGFRPQPPAAIVLDNRAKAAMENDPTAHPLYAQAKAISDLRQGLPMRQGKDAATLNNLVAKIRESEGKPPYDANQWTKVKRSNEYFTGNGKAAIALTSNDTLYGHADEVIEALNGAGLNDTRVLNTINQWISRQTGTDAKYKDLKVASKVYGSELASMLGEKDAHEKIETQKLFDNVDSPASFLAAVKQSQKMAATRSAALANQYYRETGLDPVEAGILPDRVARGAVNTVSARNYEWAKKYRTDGGGEKPAAATKQLTATELGKLPPKQAKDYLEGKTVEGPDGTRYKKGN